MENKNDSRWWALVSRYYEQLRVVVDMKHSETWEQTSKGYAQLKAIDDMKKSRLWA